MWYTATCLGCTPVLPQPFSIEAARDGWASRHAGATGHHVLLGEQHEGHGRPRPVVSLRRGVLCIQAGDPDDPLAWKPVGMVTSGEVWHVSED